MAGGSGGHLPLTPSSKIVLVVPALAYGGGVPAVARFIKDTMIRQGLRAPRILSLSTTRSDQSSLQLSSPSTWLRGVGTSSGTWEGLPVIHVGAMAGELEFQRYRPRRALTNALADCDLVQLVCGSPAWANALSGFDKPVSMHVASRVRVERRERDANAAGLIGWWRKTMTRITDRMDDTGLRLVDAIQVMNPAMLEYVRDIHPLRAHDIRYAPPGVDTRMFHPVAASAPDWGPYILCVGRLNDPRKKIGLLLDAYEMLPEPVRQKVGLMLAGSDGPPPDFWSRISASGLRDRVRFVHQPDRTALVRLYQGAAAFALPSDEEGFGMVVVEAMACGIPVVATLSGGPDGIISDGVDGFLVPRNDPEALAGRLTDLLADSGQRNAMGARARSTVEKRFAEEVAGQVFLEVWDRLLSHHGTDKCAD